MSGVGQSPSPNCPSLGRSTGARSTFSLGAGGVCMGEHQQPHIARSCELALCAVAAAGGRPGGGGCLCRGCPGLGTLRPLTARPWGVQPGPAALRLSARGVEAWEPIINPAAQALASWRGARWGGSASSLRVGCLGLGTLPPPTVRLLAIRPGTAALLVWAREVQYGGPSPTPQRTLLRAGVVRCWEGRRLPGGGASCLCKGCLGMGTLPPPAAHPWGLRSGPAAPDLRAQGMRA